MSYQISNNVASIKFIHETGEFLFMKKAIYNISLIRGDVIKISLRNCNSSIFINYQDVSIPITQTAGILVDLINVWISDYGAPDEPDK